MYVWVSRLCAALGVSCVRSARCPARSGSRSSRAVLVLTTTVVPPAPHSGCPRATDPETINMSPTSIAYGNAPCVQAACDTVLCAKTRDAPLCAGRRREEASDAPAAHSTAASKAASVSRPRLFRLALYNRTRLVPYLALGVQPAALRAAHEGARLEEVEHLDRTWLGFGAG